MGGRSKDRKPDRASSGRKIVNKDVFLKAVKKVITGKLTLAKAADVCNMSTPTFTLRFRQYVDPQQYGELPDDFLVEQKIEKVQKVEEKIVLPDLSRYL